ncbi:hypothetical protein CH296_26500 [Rhodococcus sp. 14-2496-1d]|uniref:GNAT family N-acetyltransferase n=1 Tax=Rhodococcus sp. 14-2496-1d TaxID=2023146 RepID=UPI000B9C553D|nr:GNAT family N-acetyltransferase [Rhodococcus sp. 14-2496-1d]OZF25669.1 hypothetical protein CH296_26500 [Rhodococcus sp. 14-2496-1d]
MTGTSSKLTGAHRFTVGRGFTGLRWTDVATTLTPEARTFLRREFIPIAVETFSGTTADFWDEWLADERLDDLHGLVLVLDADGIPAAWVASNQRVFGGRTCFYANSAGVRPQYQGAGLSSAIWRALLTSAIRESFPRRLHAVMRTANPLVYGAWSAAAGGIANTYPSAGTAAIPESIRRVAFDVATDLGQQQRFSPDTLVIENAYENTANGLWAQPPTSDRTDIDEWMRSILGPKDAIVLVVIFHPISILFSEAVRVVRRRFGLASKRTSRER